MRVSLSLSAVKVFPRVQVLPFIFFFSALTLALWSPIPGKYHYSCRFAALSDFREVV